MFTKIKKKFKENYTLTVILMFFAFAPLIWTIAYCIATEERAYLYVSQKEGAIEFCSDCVNEIRSIKHDDNRKNDEH